MAIKVNIAKIKKTNKKKNDNKTQKQNHIIKICNSKEVIYYNYNKKDYFAIFYSKFQKN